MVTAKGADSGKISVGHPVEEAFTIQVLRCDEFFPEALELIKFHHVVIADAIVPAVKEVLEFRIGKSTSQVDELSCAQGSILVVIEHGVIQVACSFKNAVFHEMHHLQQFLGTFFIDVLIQIIHEGADRSGEDSGRFD